MLIEVEDSQCAAYVTEFGSQFVNTALFVVQGIISFLSIIGSVLLILSYCSILSDIVPEFLIHHFQATNTNFENIQL